MMELDTGSEVLKLEIPENCSFELIKYRKKDGVADLRRSVREALRSPIASPPLKDIARPGQRIALVICDQTRYVPQQEIIPEILHELLSAGVQKEDITLVIANGLHKAMTGKEIVEMLGEQIPADLKIINHDAYDQDNLVDLGRSKKMGIPITLNKIVAESDLRIGVGIVEPHLFAGYSGGVKITSVGVAGRDTIAMTHNATVLDHPSTKFANIEGNIFREFLNEAAELVGPEFIVNLVQDSDKRAMAVFAGHPLGAFEKAVELANELFEAPFTKPADLIITVPRYPKNINLYQATRAANCLLNENQAVLKRGGKVVIPARCRDGLGGDQYYRELSGAPSPDALLVKMRREGFHPEKVKAFVLSKIMQHCELVITDTSIGGDIIRSMHLGYAENMSAYLSEIASINRQIHLIVIPDGIATIPRFKQNDC